MSGMDGQAKRRPPCAGDRKSTRLNSSHGYISYAVFCLKKKKNRHTNAIAKTQEAGSTNVSIARQALTASKSAEHQRATTTTVRPPSRIVCGATASAPDT